MTRSETTLFEFADSTSDAWFYEAPKQGGPFASLGDCVDTPYPFEPCSNWSDEHPGSSDLAEIESFYIHGKTPGDLLWYPAGICLVKSDYVDYIKSRKFTGIDFRKVNLYSRNNCTGPVTGYVDMRVTGRVPVDEKASGVSVIYKCPVCAATLYSPWDAEKGIHFKGSPSKWPDVFMMEQGMTAHIFVKPRFAQLIMDLKLRPATLTAVEDLKPFTWE